MGDEMDDAQRAAEQILAMALDARPTMREVKGDGHCNCCGEAIPPARLEAMPNADKCVTCQGIVERGSKGRG